MSLYDLAVNPVRRLVNHVGRVAETADPEVPVPATAAVTSADPAIAVVAAPDRAATGAANADPAAPATAAARSAARGVPVPTGRLRFRGRLPAKEVHARLRRCLEEMQRAERSVFIWFSEIHERRLYRELGYSSIQAYASKELDFTINRINRYLRLMNDLERLPLIRAALHAGELGWTKARAIVKVSSPANEERWLEAAKGLSRRDLESKVTQARIQAAARRRGNPAQPDLARRGGQTSEKVPSEKMLSEKTPSEKVLSENGPSEKTPADKAPSEEAGSEGLGAQALDSAAPQSQDSGSDEAPVFRPVTGAANEVLIDEGPVSVVFHFTPLELARYEVQIEKIRKKGCVAPSASREQILLYALDELIQPGNHKAGCQEQGTCEGKAEGESTREYEGEAEGESTREFEGEAEGESTREFEGEAEAESTREFEGEAEIESTREFEGQAEGESTSAFEVESGRAPDALHAIVPRGTIASPYNIVIYKCGTCQAAVVQTQRGPLGVARSQLEAAECDAVICEPGKPNRSSIPPAVRRAVMERDQHRCQAPGCRNTRFSEIHHIIPRELGGTNNPNNLIVLCSACHKLWHDKKLDERLLKRVLE